MAFIEMARDEVHGGGEWSFTKCLFSPTRTVDNKRWPFWNKILDVRKGDLILHLRGNTHHAFFVGYSIASADGYETDLRPPDPGDWSFSQRFYRADLESFIPFQMPLKLDDVFVNCRRQLEDYLERNGDKGSKRKNLFYVHQSGRLQCFNGGYLSDLDSGLAKILLNEDIADRPDQSVIQNVTTSTRFIEVEARIGQKEFSDNVKKNYNDRCCFPDCSISDERFLIGSHIARWGDNEELRGNVSNGLCLCVFHDKAFEVGLFAIDATHRVFLNKKHADWSAYRAIAVFDGRPIKTGHVVPSQRALAEHWNRIKIRFT